MRRGANHWVGGQATDDHGLALMGWSRTGGDLRVAHFFALHGQQVIPAIGWGLVAARFPLAKAGVVLASAAYVALIAFTSPRRCRGGRSSHFSVKPRHAAEHAPKRWIC